MLYTNDAIKKLFEMFHTLVVLVCFALSLRCFLCSEGALVVRLICLLRTGGGQCVVALAFLNV